MRSFSRWYTNYSNISELLSFSDEANIRIADLSEEHASRLSMQEQVIKKQQEDLEAARHCVDGLQQDKLLQTQSLGN